MFRVRRDGRVGDLNIDALRSRMKLMALEREVLQYLIGPIKKIWLDVSHPQTIIDVQGSIFFVSLLIQDSILRLYM